MRLLVIEDDDRAASYLVRGLSEAGHVVDRAGDGELGLALVMEGIFDVVILDRRLPGLDGLSILRRLRALKVATPVLVVSAVGGVLDRVEGLRAGGDDYIVKPYAFTEVLARVEALSRRTGQARENPVLRVGDLELDLGSRRVFRAGREVQLQRRELLMLTHLMRHSGQVVTRSMLLETVWDYAFEPRGNIIDMHVHRLRQKIDTGFADRLIHTVPGAGYMIRVPRPGEMPGDMPGDMPGEAPTETPRETPVDLEWKPEAGPKENPA